MLHGQAQKVRDTIAPESGFDNLPGSEAEQWGPPGRGASSASLADPKDLIRRIQPYVLVNPTSGSQGGEEYSACLMPWLNSPPGL